MASRLRTKQDYIDAGVEPPERIVHSGSDSLQPDNHVHVWKQQGNYLHCDQGQNGHGIAFDHLNKHFVGTDSATGAPIFKPVVLANQDELDKQAEAVIMENNATPSE